MAGARIEFHSTPAGRRPRRPGGLGIFPYAAGIVANVKAGPAEGPGERGGALAGTGTGVRLAANAGAEATPQNRPACANPFHPNPEQAQDWHQGGHLPAGG
jgi:hypothetical protein